MIREIHRRYYEAGADVVHTNTFGGNPVKLADRGLAERTEALNLAAVRLAREVCPDGRFVAGDMGPTGKMLRPLGELGVEDAEAAFLVQARALVRGGADLLSIETMFSLEEALAALRAAKAAGDLPVVAAVTFNRTRRGFFTMMGESAGQCVAALESAGADAIGTNCSLASRDMVDLARELRSLTDRPLLVQANAGKPVTRQGITFYEQPPEEFGRDAGHQREAGANMIGGCCGTTPEFIREVARVLSA